MPLEVMVPAVAAGLGMAVAVWSLWRYFAPAARPPGREGALRAARRARKVKEQGLLTARALVAGIGAAAMFGSLFWESALWPFFAAAGLALGPVVEGALARLSAGKMRFKRLREVAVLYECIDLFSRAGFTVRQSMQLGLPLVPGIREEVMRCLDRWPAGPLRAIQMFGEEVNLPEAQVLTGVLMHAEDQGMEKAGGIMAEEAMRLEGLRKTLAEVRVASRPLYITVYNFLPVAAALGLLIAPLAYRAITMIGGMRALD